MIPETENPQEANSVCPGQPVRHAKVDPGRYITQIPQCWFFRGTAHILFYVLCMNLTLNSILLILVQEIESQLEMEEVKGRESISIHASIGFTLQICLSSLSLFDYYIDKVDFVLDTNIYPETMFSMYFLC